MFVRSASSQQHFGNPSNKQTLVNTHDHCQASLYNCHCDLVLMKLPHNIMRAEDQLGVTQNTRSRQTYEVTNGRKPPPDCREAWQAAAGRSRNSLRKVSATLALHGCNPLMLRVSRAIVVTSAARRTCALLRQSGWADAVPCLNLPCRTELAAVAPPRKRLPDYASQVGSAPNP